MSGEFVVSLVALFVSVAVLAGTIAMLVLRRHAPERKRLRALAQPADEPLWREPQFLTDAPNPLAERISRIVPRSAERMSEMRQRLVTAGYRSHASPVVFAASQIVSATVIGVVVLAIGGNFPIALLSLIAGFLLPGFWLSRQIKKRGRVIQNGLPDVLDLLIICLESGCSLDQALLKSGEELAVAYRAIGDELTVVTNEIRAGTARSEALTHLVDRTRVDDVRSLVAMLVQTDRYGTSIAHALRVHADLLRSRRRQRAEERAAKASVKLVFPLVLCLFPAFYLIALGPALLQVVDAFVSAMSGFE
ncbi:MAG TPA: type II secretion system F family protein [Vicinamibacterales bacterium]|jgi:tight adherence protein C